MSSLYPLASLMPLFLLGVFGAGHRIGMCGPLCIAFPGRIGALRAHLLYHLGRVTTYTLVGAVLGGLGAIGNAAASDPDLIATATKIQLGFSVVAALFLILFALVRLELVKEPRFMIAISPHRIPGVGAVAKAAGNTGKLWSMMPLGLALGFLPCGLSYAAFAKAVAAGGPVRGALFLVAFGLGTVPGLLFVGTAASRLLIKHRRLFDLVAALIMVGMAADILADVIPVLL
jgi:uncharacterized protein